MTAEQNRTYYETLAVRMGCNAIRFALDGKDAEAQELARNAVRAARTAYPTLN